jgi:hypothetical protein
MVYHITINIVHFIIIPNQVTENEFLSATRTWWFRGRCSKTFFITGSQKNGTTANEGDIFSDLHMHIK